MQVYQHRVQYYETDQMGIAHHSNYIRWFEEARVDFMERFIVDYRELEKFGYLIPVVDVECHYKKPVLFGEVVKVAVQVTGFGHVKFKMAYTVRDAETGEMRASGQTSHCFIDRTGQIVALQKLDPRLYAEIEQRVKAFEADNRTNIY